MSSHNGVPVADVKGKQLATERGGSEGATIKTLPRQKHTHKPHLCFTRAQEEICFFLQHTVDSIFFAFLGDKMLNVMRTV